MINWQSFFFLLYALAACWFAVAVVVSSNIVRMAFYLVLALGAVSGLFFLAGADFVGAVQLMIYVGGTVVLLAFGVMLTARSQWITMRTTADQWVLAVIVGGSLLAVLLQSAFAVRSWQPPQPATAAAPSQPGPAVGRLPGASPPPRQSAQEAPREPPGTAAPLGLGFLGVRVDRLDQPDPTLRAGMCGYLLPFEIISVHLVVVLVGAAFLARTKMRKRT